jgi:UDP-2,4-diacetamido-2,4,6-trideoxy-beta-L-altropyranose hydrolase
MGTGHIMRCLTLADELKGHGAEITFITRAHPGNLGDVIIKRGYELCLLPAPADTYQVRKDDVAHASWLGVPWEQDAEETKQALDGSSPERLIVDHYGIDARWHRELRNKVGRLMVIDDLADRPLDCDMLLDQTYGRQEDDYRKWVPSRCQMLLGSRYALLRPIFSELRSMAIVKRKAFNGINRILVSMGGMDPDNVTATVLEGLSFVNYEQKPVIDVVMGSKSPHWRQVVTQAEKSVLEMIVSTDVTDMAERMLEADLAIGAGGTTSWERCCLGLPALAVISAENQQMVSKELDEKGAIRLLGIGREICAVDIKKNIERLMLKPIQLHNMSQAGFGVTDGLGVKRTTLEMMPPYSKDGRPVILRPVRLTDTDLLFDWQSDDKTRRYAHNPKKPNYDEHRAWVRNRIEKTDAYTEIIIHGDDPAGVIRLDPINAGVYMISIYIAPEKYSLGIGKSALSYVSQLLPDTEFRAEIHEDNHASKALFASMGFTQIGNGEYVKYACKKESRV